MKKKLIFVTEPSLPDINDFFSYLEKIWESKTLTNGGPFHQELELALSEYLGVKNLSLFSNGTLALITALQTLEVKGEVITTPYSFVATTHSLLWNGNKPVFVDVEPRTLNINPQKIEAAITEKTTAIMPVHCYGNPCDVEGIQKIANKYGLKVIYDAAHAFGVECHCGSVLNHGDLSVLSFHATKVFNTFEGGAIISHDIETKRRVDQLKNFGFVNEVSVVAPGINAKMSEINAAFGLLQLKDVNQMIRLRESADKFYRENLADVKGIFCLPQIAHTPNYSYFPILVQQGYRVTRDRLYEEFKDQGIYTRRYFYPLISDFPMYQDFPSSNHFNLPIAVKASSEVLCLPIYPNLSRNDQMRVIHMIKKKNESPLSVFR
jgi:dTDP-4-amino-4,6-dideoxygalactose transaminase